MSQPEADMAHKSKSQTEKAFRLSSTRLPKNDVAGRMMHAAAA